MHSITVILSTLMAISSNAMNPTNPKAVPRLIAREERRNKQLLNRNAQGELKPYSQRAPFRRRFPPSQGLISAGSMGKVYRVKSPNPTERYAVVKVFFNKEYPQSIADCDHERAILEEIASYEAEKGAHLQISHIQKGYPMVSPRLMLEYINGKDLTKAGFTKHRASMSEFVDIILSPMMRQISEVFKGLHSAHIYHNDIKPANILFVPTPTPKFYLIDFGLAYSLSKMDDPTFEFQRVSPWCTLQFMSRYHLHLMHEQLLSESEQRTDSIREAAGKAEYYSLAITAIITVADYCPDSAMDDPLFELAQGLVRLQNDWGDYELDFITWELQKLEGILIPFWNQVAERISKFRQQHPTLHPEFMELLAEWTSLGEFPGMRTYG